MKQQSLSRRNFLKLAGASSAALAAGGGLAAALARAADGESGARPNIVLILADDLGYGELGCQGNRQIPTPNIDSIASGGIRFTDGYVSCPVCSPTRAGLMTGRYQQRFGHEFNPGPAQQSEEFGLPITESTIADRLKKAGYTTGLVGKWHLGALPQYHPQKRGFDEFFGFLAGAHAYFPQPNQAPILRGTETVEEKEYLTDAFAREAVSFIKRHSEKPFFLYLALNAVHSPLQAPDKYLSRFSGISDPKRQKFAAMLSAMDDAVGKTLGALRDARIEENTLVIFLSDNGGPTPGTTSKNGALKGTKGQVHEGGIRVPFMLRWKGTLPAGKTDSRPVISLDIAPTALAAAGAASSESFDGTDLLPYLKGEKTTVPHATLYWRFGSQYAIRRGDWKLVQMDEEAPQLYNLKRDIGEATNLASDNKEQAADLKADLERWNKTLAAPRWQPQRRPAKAARPKRRARRAEPIPAN